MTHTTIRAIIGRIEIYKQFLAQSHQSLSEYDSVQKALALTERQLDEAETVWRNHNARR